MQLAGPLWQKGSDEVFDYQWRDYGRLMEMRSKGLFGNVVARIAADPAGALRVSITETDPGTVAQSSVSLLKSGFAMNVVDQGTPVRTTVTLNGGALVSNRYSGPQFANLEKSSVARVVSEEAASAYLKTVKTTYPRRRPGSFDPKLGVLELMAGGDWIQKIQIYDGKATAGGDRPLLLAKTTGMPPQLIYVPEYSEIDSIGDSSANSARLFSRAANGIYQADVLATTSSTPEGHAIESLVVQRDGSSRVYQAVQAMDQWYLSDDGRTAMEISSVAQDGAWKEASRQIYGLRPPRPAPASVLDRLSGRIFRNGSGYFGIKWAGAVGGTFYTYVKPTDMTRIEASIWCSKAKDTNYLNCVEYHESGNKPVAMQGNASNFSLGGYTYVPRADGGLERSGPDGKTVVMPAVSSAQFAFESGDKRDVRRINENYRAQARNQENARREQAENDKMWAGVIGTLARGFSSPGVAYTTVQTNWGAAGCVGQVATAGARGNGSVGDMGGVTYVPAPVATPEQRRLQDEIQRAEIRRELYAPDGRAAVRRERAERTTQANRNLAEHQAAYDQRHADSDASNAKFDEDRARDQRLAEAADKRKREADDAAEKDRRTRLAADRDRQAKQAADAERARATAIEDGVIVMVNPNTGGCFQVSNVHNLEVRAAEQAREQGGGGWRREYKANRAGYGAVFAAKPKGQSAHFFIRDGFRTSTEAITEAQTMANRFAGETGTTGFICSTWHTKGGV